MKKIFIVLLMGFLVVSLTGCGDEKSTTKEDIGSDKLEEKGDYVYMFDVHNRMKIGTEPSKYGELYKTAEEAMKAYGHNMTIRHTLENGKIKESYVGFVYKDKIYFLKGQDTKIYDQNKKKLKEIFGDSKCVETSDFFNCYDDNIGVIIRKDGSTEVGIDKEYCISYDDFAKCGTAR